MEIKIKLQIYFIFIMKIIIKMEIKIYPFVLNLHQIKYLFYGYFRTF